VKFYRQASARIKIRNANFQYVDEITIKDLRISFSITKSLAWSTNSCVLKIWNLSQKKRNIIKDFGDEVTIYAGYELAGGPEVLFIGQTTAVSHIYEQPEIISVLECGDGEKFINQLRISISYAANTSARTIIRGIASQMGIVISEFADSDDLIYRQGFKFNGMGKDALTTVCDKLNLQWSVQNNTLQIIPQGGTITQPTIQINQNTGMQGVPTRFTYRSLDLYRAINQPNTGYKVNVALDPFILPGAKIDLYSTHLDFKGPYRVETVRHEGDTFGFLWQTNLEVRELKSGSTQ